MIISDFFKRFFICILALILLEGALQIYFRKTQERWIFTKNDNFTFPYVKRVNDRRQYSLRENYKDEQYTINAEGFRSDSIENDNRPLICVIGDSVPYGAGVSDQETFPVHLQRILDRQGANFRILNAGVPSYNLRQSIDRWHFDIKSKYECNIIILCAANDISLIAHYGKNWSPNLTWANARFNIALTRRSALFYYVNLILARLQADSNWRSKALQTLADDIQAQLNTLIIEAKIPVVILPINPCYYQDRSIDDSINNRACNGYANFIELSRSWGSLIQDLNKILKKSSDSNGLYFLDAVTAFDQKFGREEKFIDFFHYSNKGNKDIAQLIADFLSDQKLVSNE